jgi:hypothetical protein
MTTTRHRNAWIWVAIAALSIAVAQSGIQSARAYTHPVFEFIAAHSIDQPEAANAVQRFLHSRGARADRHSATSSQWAAMLPVQFVGVVSPLNLVSPKSFLCIGCATAAPALPFSYQRPPPSTLL